MFLGDPKDFQAGAGNRQLEPRKKSDRKVQSDKARAAKIHERTKRDMVHRLYAGRDPPRHLPATTNVLRLYHMAIFMLHHILTLSC